MFCKNGIFSKICLRRCRKHNISHMPEKIQTFSDTPAWGVGEIRMKMCFLLACFSFENGLVCVFSCENKTNLFYPKRCFCEFISCVFLPFSLDCLSLFFSSFLVFFLVCVAFLYLGFHEQKQNSKLERVLSSMFFVSLFHCFGRASIWPLNLQYCSCFVVFCLSFCFEHKKNPIFPPKKWYFPLFSLSVSPFLSP